MDLRHVFKCMISVSELGRGQASKVIQAIEETGNPYIIVKNNKPQAVILSIDDYSDLLRARELLTSMQSYASAGPAPLAEPFSMADLALSDAEVDIFLADTETYLGADGNSD